MDYKKAKKILSEKSFSGEKVNDNYAWLEEFSEDTKSFTKEQNSYTEEYLKNNDNYEEYKKNICELFINQIAMVKERKDLLFSMIVDNNDNRFLAYSSDNFKTINVIVSDEDMGDDEKIEKYDISPNGLYISIITRNLWSVHHKAYIYNLNTKKLIKSIDRCSQVVFCKNDNIYAQIPADLNDETQTNQVVQGKIDNDMLIDMKTIFEISEMYNMDIVISEGDQYIFLNILIDYYENDYIYYKKIADNEFKVLVDGSQGRYFYIGSDDKYHYLQTNNQCPNYKIVAVSVDDMNLNSAIEIVKESQNPHAAKAKRSAFKVKDKLLILENKYRGQAIKIVDLKTLEECYISCGAEGVYFNNLYDLNIEDKDNIYFTYESIIVPISIYKLNIKSLQIEKLYNRKEIKDLKISSFDYNNKNVVVISKHNIKDSKTIISFNYGYSSDLTFNSNNFNVKTPVIEWVESGNVYVEYNISAYELKNIENIFDEIDGFIDYLTDNNISYKGQIGLFDGGYVYSLAQMYCIKRPMKVSAICTVGGRTDLLNYINDATAYMFKEALGDATADKDTFELLYKYSPYHNVKPGMKYPSHLLLCNDYSLLVPSYHTKKMIAALQEYNTSRANLMRCFQDENFIEMIVDMFAFFHKELVRGANDEYYNQ